MWHWHERQRWTHPASSGRRWLWTPATPAGGATSHPPPPTMPHVRALDSDANRAGPGSHSEPVQPASCHRHSARGGSLPCRGAGHDESERPATDLDVACKITCTSHCTTMTAASSCRSSYFAPKNEPLLRLAALVTAVAEVWRGFLPPQASILGPPGQFFDVALHTLHRLPSKSELVGSSYYQVFKFYTGNSVPHTTRPRRLHCTAQAHHGHTQTRVDLRVAPLLL